MSIIIPQDLFARIKLLNQFCHIDYPQGDFVKHEDGVFTYSGSDKKTKTAEITIDGPVNHLFIDIDE